MSLIPPHAKLKELKILWWIFLGYLAIVSTTMLGLLLLVAQHLLSLRRAAAARKDVEKPVENPAAHQV
jgi:hypothetical protein